MAGHAHDDRIIFGDLPNGTFADQISKNSVNLGNGLTQINILMLAFGRVNLGAAAKGGKQLTLFNKLLRSTLLNKEAAQTDSALDGFETLQSQSTGFRIVNKGYDVPAGYVVAASTYLVREDDADPSRNVVIDDAGLIKMQNKKEPLFTFIISETAARELKVDLDPKPNANASEIIKQSARFDDSRVAALVTTILFPGMPIDNKADDFDDDEQRTDVAFLYAQDNTKLRSTEDIAFSADKMPNILLAVRSNGKWISPTEGAAAVDIDMYAYHSVWHDNAQTARRAALTAVRSENAEEIRRTVEACLQFPCYSKRVSNDIENELLKFNTGSTHQLYFAVHR